LLHAAARDGFLHAHHDGVADIGVAALGTAEHLDAHHAARAGIVGDVQLGGHLNHMFCSWRFLFAPYFPLTRSKASQVFSFEIGRHSLMRTMSPALNSPFSSWAWYFFERRTVLPITGWVKRRSTFTTTVFL